MGEQSPIFSIPVLLLQALYMALLLWEDQQAYKQFAVCLATMPVLLQCLQTWMVYLHHQAVPPLIVEACTLQ